jgi:hypothetical protein
VAKLLGFAVICRGLRLAAPRNYATAAQLARLMNEGIGSPPCSCPLSICRARYHVKQVNADLSVRETSPAIRDYLP